MVALIPKTSIQAKNIDTVEKAIVFGALALRAAVVGDDNSNTSDRSVYIRVVPQKEGLAKLDIDLYLKYDAYKANISGGDFFNAIQEYEANSATIATDLELSSIPSDSLNPMVDYPELVVDTFEKYIYFYCLSLHLSLGGIKNDYIKITPFANQDNPELFIDISLIINYDLVLDGNNYLNALSQVGSDYFTPSVPLPGGGSSSNLHVFTFSETINIDDVNWVLVTYPFDGRLLSVEVNADVNLPSQYDAITFTHNTGSFVVPRNGTGPNGYPKFSWAESTPGRYFNNGDRLRMLIPSFTEVEEFSTWITVEEIPNNGSGGGNDSNGGGNDSPGGGNDSLN